MVILYRITANEEQYNSVSKLLTLTQGNIDLHFLY